MRKLDTPHTPAVWSHHKKMHFALIVYFHTLLESKRNKKLAMPVYNAVTVTFHEDADTVIVNYVHNT